MRSNHQTVESLSNSIKSFRNENITQINMNNNTNNSTNNTNQNRFSNCNLRNNMYFANNSSSTSSSSEIGATPSILNNNNNNSSESLSNSLPSLHSTFADNRNNALNTNNNIQQYNNHDPNHGMYYLLFFLISFYLIM